MTDQLIPTDPWLDNRIRLHADQVELLLRGIDKRRVKFLDNHSYITTYDVRIWLNRIFGFAGWSLTAATPTALVFEAETMIGANKDKPGVRVAYRSDMLLTIHTNYGDAHYAGSSVGEAVMPDYKRADAHDMALKSAESGALKRAASNLGDQFGISLYNNGSIVPHVRKVWDGTKFHSLGADSEPEPELEDEQEYTTGTQEEGTS